MKRTLMKNTFILTLVAIINRIITLVFRTYLVNKTGSEFLGIYNIILMCFTFFSSFVISGIAIAVTRVIGDDIVKHKSYSRNNRLFKFCVLISVSIGIISALLLFSMSGFITNIIGDKRLINPLKILSLCIPLISFSACFRGYFYAYDKIIFISIKELLEQISEIIIFFIFILNMKYINVESISFSIAWGIVLSELVSLIYSFIYFVLYYHKYNKYKYYLKHSEINSLVYPLKKFIKIILTIGSTFLIDSCFLTIKSIIIPKYLVKYGLSYNYSISIYGLISGMILPIIIFPSVLLSSFSSLLIPRISTENSVHYPNKSYNSITINKAVEFSFIFSFFVLGIYLFFSNQISCILKKDITFYLKLFSIVIPFAYLNIVLDSILKALNKQFFLFVSNIVLSVISIVFILKFIPIYGVKALIYNTLFINIINFCFNLYYLNKVSNINININFCIAKPMTLLVITYSLFCLFHIYNYKYIFVLVYLLFYLRFYFLKTAVLIL